MQMEPSSAGLQRQAACPLNLYQWPESWGQGRLLLCWPTDFLEFCSLAGMLAEWFCGYIPWACNSFRLHPGAKVDMKLMAIGTSSFCHDFSPPTLVTCYKNSDLLWSRPNCGIGMILSLYIPDPRRQSSGAVARAPWIRLALERAEAKSPLGQSVRSGSAYPQPTGISCTFLLAKGRLEPAPQKSPQRQLFLTYSYPQSSCSKGGVAHLFQALPQGYLTWKQDYQLSNTATLLTTSAQSCKVPELEET